MPRLEGVNIVVVTDGAPRDMRDAERLGFRSRQEYAATRAGELQRALALVGIGASCIRRLGMVDQETALELPRLIALVRAIVREKAPPLVLTHAYEGGHPDHDACAFAVHHAVALLRFRHEPAPVIIEAPFYHAGKLGQGLETGSFLPAESPAREVVCQLSPQEQQSKQALLDCFVTQREFLRCFSVAEERFRMAPVYEFRRQPNFGAVFYDNYSWGVKSRAFCDLAWEAEDALDEEMKAACC